MNLPDEKREALAEGICSAICEGTAPAGIPGAENPRHRIAACYEHQRAADALAPLLAGWLAEADLDARASEMQGKADSLTGQLIKAQAWDEGYRSGHSNAMRRMSDEPNAPTTLNPYRSAQTTRSEK